MSWREIREKAQYPSWPDPVKALKCESCEYEIAVTPRGRAGLSRARSIIRRHECNGSLGEAEQNSVAETQTNASRGE